MEVPLYDRSVFINCPFDLMYWPILEAITFSVAYCGFVPRCSLETDDGSQVRIQKINSLIRSCRLAIHDISRTESDGAPPLPRFNMPLELGIFMGAKEFGNREQKRKAAVILDAERYRYQRFVSDIAGQDIRAHAGGVFEAIAHVRNFLFAYSHAPQFLPGPDRIAERYRDFREELPHMCEVLHTNPARLTFPEFTHLVRGYIEREAQAAHIGDRAA
ncbi:hypothetical protein [Longimicrobium terrae]|nr:hypothetical protein [Longimicrobium terrae]